MEEINYGVEPVPGLRKGRASSNERTVKHPHQYVTFSHDIDMMTTDKREKPSEGYHQSSVENLHHSNQYKSHEEVPYNNVATTEPDIFSREAADSTLKSQPSQSQGPGT